MALGLTLLKTNLNPSAPRCLNLLLVVPLLLQQVIFESKSDEIPEVDNLEESDDEDLGSFQKTGVVVGRPHENDPENEGKELEALAKQTGELAVYMKSIIDDIRELDSRVHRLESAGSK